MVSESNLPMYYSPTAVGAGLNERPAREDGAGLRQNEWLDDGTARQRVGVGMFRAVDLQVPVTEWGIDEGAMVRLLRILRILPGPEVPAGETHQAGGDLLGLLKLQEGVEQVGVQFLLGGRTE